MWYIRKYIWTRVSSPRECTCHLYGILASARQNVFKCSDIIRNMWFYHTCKYIIMEYYGILWNFFQMQTTEMIFMNENIIIKTQTHIVWFNLILSFIFPIKIKHFFVFVNFSILHFCLIFFLFHNKLLYTFNYISFKIELCQMSYIFAVFGELATYTQNKANKNFPMYKCKDICNVYKI